MCLPYLLGCPQQDDICGHSSILLNDDDVTHRDITAITHFIRFYCFQNMFRDWSYRSITNINNLTYALLTDTLVPSLVNFSYCSPFISLSRRNRTKSSRASRIKVMHSTKPCEERGLLGNVVHLHHSTVPSVSTVLTNGPQYVMGDPICIMGMNWEQAMRRK